MAEHEENPFPWRLVKGYHCFGCCPDNPAGVALRFELDAEGRLVCPIRLTKLHESYPGIIHGGVATTILDELMGNCIAMRDSRLCYSTSLRVRFLAPLRTGDTYTGQARILEPMSADHNYRVGGEIIDRDANVMVASTGTYRWITLESAASVMGLTPEDTKILAPFLYSCNKS